MRELGKKVCPTLAPACGRTLHEKGVVRCSSLVPPLSWLYGSHQCFKNTKKGVLWGYLAAP